MPILHLDARNVREYFFQALEVLENNQDLLNDINTYPVPDFDCGTNLISTWRQICQGIETLPETSNIGQLLLVATRAAQQSAKGSSGVLLHAAFQALCQVTEGKELLSPIDLINIFSTLAKALQETVGMRSNDFTPVAWAQKVCQQLKKLEGELSLEMITTSAMVVGQELMIDCAALRQGVPDSGLTAATLLVSIDITGRKENANIQIVQAMLQNFANRSRENLSSPLRRSLGGEFEVRYHCDCLLSELPGLRTNLESLATDVLISSQNDGFGWAKNLIHLHTDNPLAVTTGSTHDIYVKHLDPPHINAEKDEDFELQTWGDSSTNVRLLEPRNQQGKPAQIEIYAFTNAPGLIETLARTRAHVILRPSGENNWKSQINTQADLVLLLAGSENCWQEITAFMQESRDVKNPIYLVPEIRDEAALWSLTEDLSSWMETKDFQVSQIGQATREIKDRIQKLRALNPSLQITDSSQIEHVIEELLSRVDDYENSMLTLVLGAPDAFEVRSKLQNLSMAQLPEILYRHGGQEAHTSIGLWRR